MKNRNILSFQIRGEKCKFTRSCNLYSNQSYTCTHLGGEYCGKYRALSQKPKDEQMLEELLVQ